MDRRPNCSEKEDHQRGKMAIEIMYNATERLVTVSEALNSRAKTGRAAFCSSALYRFNSNISKGKAYDTRLSIQGAPQPWPGQ